MISFLVHFAFSSALKELTLLVSSYPAHIQRRRQGQLHQWRPSAQCAAPDCLPWHGPGCDLVCPRLCLVSLPATACRGKTEVWPTHTISGFSASNSLQRENRGLTNTYYVWFLSQQRPAEGEQRSDQHKLCLVSLPATSCRGRTEVWPTHTMSGFSPNNGLQRENRGLTNTYYVWFLCQQQPAEGEQRSDQNKNCSYCRKCQSCNWVYYNY